MLSSNAIRFHLCLCFTGLCTVLLFSATQFVGCVWVVQTPLVVCFMLRRHNWSMVFNQVIGFQSGHWLNLGILYVDSEPGFRFEVVRVVSVIAMW